MKKTYLILVFAMLASFASAQTTEQQPPQVSEQKQQDIEALKVAFISKELELTPAEAEKFLACIQPVFKRNERTEIGFQ
jgi:hypothetical protein